MDMGDSNGYGILGQNSTCTKFITSSSTWYYMGNMDLKNKVAGSGEHHCNQN